MESPVILEEICDCSSCKADLTVGATVTVLRNPSAMGATAIPDRRSQVAALNPQWYGGCGYHMDRRAKAAIRIV